MYTRYIGTILLFIGLTQLTGYVYSQENKERLLSTWNVAIVGIVSEDFDSLDSLTKTTSLSVIPLLQTLVREVKERQLSTKELYLAREFLRERSLEVLGIELIKKQDELNNKNLKEEENLDIWNNRRLEEKKINEMKTRIQKIRDIKNEDIPVKSTLPIKLIENNTSYNIQSTTSLNRIAITAKAQELLYYTVETLNRFVVISLYTYHSLFNESTKILQTIVEPTDIQQLFTSIGPTVRTAVLGVPAGSLSIKAVTENSQILNDAKILLDGNLIGFGEVYLSTIISGTHAIQVVHNNQQRDEVLIVQELEPISRTFLFSTTNNDTITILTEPSDAKVYINSEWVGNSPVTILRPSFSKQMEITFPEHATKRLTLNHLTPSVVRLALEQTNAIPLEERLKKERNDFYTAFTIMGASLIPPLILYGLYINEANTLQSAGNDIHSASYQESITRRDTYFYATLGTSALSVAAMVWLSFEIADYVRVGNEFHTR